MQDWIWFLVIKCFHYDFVFAWICFFPNLVYSLIALGALVVMVARGAYPIYRPFSTCSSWTRPRLTRMNRGASWQDEGSERRTSSELEQKPRFKETINEICFLYSLVLELQQKTRSNFYIGFISPLFLLLSPEFSRLDVFSWFFHRLDAKTLFKIKVFSAY
jgi:hypothetical protein